MNDFEELITKYQETVLYQLRFYQTGLQHHDPAIRVHAALQLQAHILNGGGLVACLEREGYDNYDFYHSIKRTAATLLDAVLSSDEGLSKKFMTELAQSILSSECVRSEDE